MNDPETKEIIETIERVQKDLLFLSNTLKGKKYIYGADCLDRANREVNNWVNLAINKSKH